MDDDKILTLITDCVLHVGNISWKYLDIKPFHKYINIHTICVHNYIHKDDDVQKELNTHSYVGHRVNYSEESESESHNNLVVYFVQPHYNILFITHPLLKTKIFNLIPSLNTKSTINTRYHINDNYVSVCVGYSNEASFTDEKHMFSLYKDNGVFFI